MAMEAAKRFINRALEATGLRLIRLESLYPWQRDPVAGWVFHPGRVPEPLDAELRPDNPRLLQLIAAYAEMDPKVIRPAKWTENLVDSNTMLNFRGHNPYIYQLTGKWGNELGYALTYYALKSGPAADLLESLEEDDLFGVIGFFVDGRLVTRDLLDSVREIDFIRTHVGLNPGTTILDIGAGYGRLIHRLSRVTGAGVRLFATDAIAVSSFIAESYLRFRKTDRAAVIPLPDVEQFLGSTPVSLATNIHSFPECTRDGIDWWVERLARSRVPYLLIVPRLQGADGRCITNAGEDMEAVLERHGYRIRVREPRFSDPIVQRYGVDPSMFNLFTLTI
jgi:hypothetical protein